MTTEKQISRLNLSQKEVLMAEKNCPGSAKNTISLKLYLPDHTPGEVKTAADTVLDSADVFNAFLCREEGGCMLSFGQGKISECGMEEERSADWVEGYMDITDRLPMDTARHLYRANVFPLSGGGVLLYVRFHRIIMDCHGMGLFVQRVLDVLAGKSIVRSMFDGGNILKPADWTADYTDGGNLSDEKKFWKSYFADAEFDTAIFRRKADGENIGRYRVSVPEEIAGEVAAYGAREHHSMPCLFETAYAFYLAQATDKRDAVFLVPCVNRTREQMDTLGCYALFVPVRVRVDAGDTFSELCRKVRKAEEEAFSHRGMGFHNIFAALREDGVADEAVSEFIFHFFRFPVQSDLRYRARFSLAGYLSNHLTFGICYNEKGGLDLQFDYQEEVYTRKGIKNLCEAVLTILLQGLQPASVHSASECIFGDGA